MSETVFITGYLQDVVRTILRINVKNTHASEKTAVLREQNRSSPQALSPGKLSALTDFLRYKEPSLQDKPDEDVHRTLRALGDEEYWKYRDHRIKQEERYFTWLGRWKERIVLICGLLLIGYFLYSMSSFLKHGISQLNRPLIPLFIFGLYYLFKSQLSFPSVQKHLREDRLQFEDCCRVFDTLRKREKFRVFLRWFCAVGIVVTLIVVPLALRIAQNRGTVDTRTKEEKQYSALKSEVEDNLKKIEGMLSRGEYVKALNLSQELSTKAYKLEDALKIEGHPVAEQYTQTARKACRGYVTGMWITGPDETGHYTVIWVTNSDTEYRTFSFNSTPSAQMVRDLYDNEPGKHCVAVDSVTVSLAAEHSVSFRPKQGGSALMMECGDLTKDSVKIDGRVYSRLRK